MGVDKLGVDKTGVEEMGTYPIQMLTIFINSYSLYDNFHYDQE